MNYKMNFKKNKIIYHDETLLCWDPERLLLCASFLHSKWGESSNWHDNFSFDSLLDLR